VREGPRGLLNINGLCRPPCDPGSVIGAEDPRYRDGVGSVRGLLLEQPRGLELRKTQRDRETS
jgi:hypothetical protein